MIKLANVVQFAMTNIGYFTGCGMEDRLVESEASCKLTQRELNSACFGQLL